VKLRLPYALALAAASLSLAAVTLVPFTPPDPNARMTASEVQTAPEVLRPFMADGLYQLHRLERDQEQATRLLGGK
jgi:hypothetical protein